MPRQTPDGILYERNTAPIPWGVPKYKLNDCKCGAKQDNHDVYTLYVGAGSNGAWYVRCKKCGAVIGNTSEEVAVDMWNRGEINSRSNS